MKSVAGRWKRGEVYLAKTCISTSGLRIDFPSEVRNPLGKVIATTSKAADYAIANINLDYKTVSLANNLEKLVALKSKYGNTVQISETSRNGRVIVTSSNKSVSSVQMIREFNIEPFNEYLDRARSIRTEDMPAD